MEVSQWREKEDKMRKAARHWMTKFKNTPEFKNAPGEGEVERERAAAGRAVAAAAASPRTRGLSLVEEEYEAESRCGGDGVYSQEGKIQKVRGVAAAGGAPPARE